MATWNDLSRDAMLAARQLLNENRLRSSASRAYYAAYSAVAARMTEKAVTFPRGWNNPSHDQLVPWLTRNSQWSQNRRRQLVYAMRRLRDGRETADYRPKISLTRGDAIRSMRDADLVMRFMEVSDESAA